MNIHLSSHRSPGAVRAAAAASAARGSVCRRVRVRHAARAARGGGGRAEQRRAQRGRARASRALGEEQVEGRGCHVDVRVAATTEPLRDFRPHHWGKGVGEKREVAREVAREVLEEIND